MSAKIVNGCQLPQSYFCEKYVLRRFYFKFDKLYNSEKKTLSQSK
jgi:hypothetical protein